MKLSIIVPIYNTEKYLRKCVDSILAQTLTDFECILVDDGSTDNCPAICDEYAEKDPRIVVIHKQNGGQSDARNKGLDIARGDYIGFVDSDDWIESEMYEELHAVAIKYGTDITGCRLKYFDENYNITALGGDSSSRINFYTPDELLNDFSSIQKKVVYSSCSKIFSRKLFTDLRYVKGKICEDASMLFDMLDKCTKIALLEKCLYCYFSCRKNSSVNSSYNERRLDRIDLYNKIYDLYVFKKKSNQLEYILPLYVEAYMQNHLMIYTEFKQYRQIFSPYKQQAKDRTPDILKNSQICNLKKAFWRLMFISPHFVKWLCKKYYPELTS